MKAKTYMSILLFLGAFLSLAACAPYRPNSAHAGLCNELNSRMIFSGSTSSIRKAEIQASEEPLVERSYDTKCGN